MAQTYNKPPKRQRKPVTVRRFLDEGLKRGLGLEVVVGEIGFDRVVGEALLHRPGLALTGYHRYFANARIQVVGQAEHAYLKSLKKYRRKRVEELFAQEIPCLVFTKDLSVFEEVREAAEASQTTVLRTEMLTSEFLRRASLLLEDVSAPFGNIYGTMLEVCGLGVFIEGPPGIGKSETALGLLKRGHALVADDLTHIRRTSSDTLMASAKEQTRGFMEIRGIGFINVWRTFGIGAVRGEKQLDLVVTLKRQEDFDELDRIGTGLACEFLGVSVKHLLLPVALGRELVNLVETAAQEYVLRASGYSAADDLDSRVKAHHVEGGKGYGAN
ncbi:MAG: HPr(Ser) kinase/phosphatase [Kiritimatiellaeota bacterium]|nr:HPr(Ser) kinase/phosphatase [Kiritimatiellota bacterium]